MARMSYTPMPISLNQDERLTTAPPELRLTYLCLRIGSDSWGRFPADAMALRLVSGILDQTIDVVDHLATLGGFNMIDVWVGDDGRRYAEITGYDDALTVNMIRRRGESEIPARPDFRRLTHESITSKGRQPHETVTPGGQAPEDPQLTSESRSTLPSCARASRSEPSRAEPSLADPPPSVSPSRAREAEPTDGGDLQDTLKSAEDQATTPPEGDLQSLASHTEDGCQHRTIVSCGDGYGRCEDCGDNTFPWDDEPGGYEPDRIDPALSPPAVAWLTHRVDVCQRHGHSFATLGEADDLHGHTMRRLQRSPGFGASVEKMLKIPDDRWGKSMRGGIAYLERMVHDWIAPTEKPAIDPRQAHLCQPGLSVAEYTAKTGIDPTKAPIEPGSAEAMAEFTGAAP